MLLQSTSKNENLNLANESFLDERHKRAENQSPGRNLLIKTQIKFPRISLKRPTTRPENHSRTKCRDYVKPRPTFFPSLSLSLFLNELDVTPRTKYRQKASSQQKQQPNKKAIANREKPPSSNSLSPLARRVLLLLSRR